jgi:hypothetical protein
MQQNPHNKAKETHIFSHKYPHNSPKEINILAIKFHIMPLQKKSC